VESWLARYHDGEVSERRRRQVEAHLHRCEACRRELERLEQLSGVLAAYALPEMTRADRFRSQVMLRLPRHKSKRVRHASWAWHLVPIGLIGVLVGLEVLLFVPDLLALSAAVASWAGVDLYALIGLTADSQGWWGTVLAPWAAPQLYGLFRFTWQVCVAFALMLVFVPYAGWVGTLWRARTVPNGS